MVSYETHYVKRYSNSVLGDAELKIPPVGVFGCGKIIVLVVGGVGTDTGDSPAVLHFEVRAVRLGTVSDAVASGENLRPGITVEGEASDTVTQSVISLDSDLVDLVQQEFIPVPLLTLLGHFHDSV